MINFNFWKIFGKISLLNGKSFIKVKKNKKYFKIYFALRFWSVFFKVSLNQFNFFVKIYNILNIKLLIRVYHFQKLV